MGTCSECVHYNETFTHEKYPNSGQCRINPPTLVTHWNDAERLHEQESVWPQVQASDWCGQFTKTLDGILQTLDELAVATEVRLLREENTKLSAEVMDLRRQKACSGCGKLNDLSRKFCRSCATPLEAK